MAELQKYFIKASDNSRNPNPRTAFGREEETGSRSGGKRVEGGGGAGAVAGYESGGESLKLSIVETQPLDSLLHGTQAVPSAT